MTNRIKAWAESYTEQGRFSPVGVAFHWVVAALVLFQLGLGWWLGFMRVGGDKLAAYELHAAIGLAIFVLAAFRLVWRIMVTDPWNSADTMGWRSTVAYVVEHSFYVAFFLLPVTGWVMWSAEAPPGPLSVGGVLPWPQLPLETLEPAYRWRLMQLAETVHTSTVWVLIVLIGMHVGAALKHHFWDRNDVLRGMLPQFPKWSPPGVAQNSRQARRSRKGSGAD